MPRESVELAAQDVAPLRTPTSLAAFAWYDGTSHVRLYGQSAQGIVELCCDGGTWQRGAVLADAAVAGGTSA